MITAAILGIVMSIWKGILSIVWNMGGAVFSVADLITQGQFSAVVPLLDAFVDINVLQGAIGSVLSVYSALWLAFITNWVIKRIRGG